MISYSERRAMRAALNRTAPGPLTFDVKRLLDDYEDLIAIAANDPADPECVRIARRSMARFCRDGADETIVYFSNGDESFRISHLVQAYDELLVKLRAAEAHIEQSNALAEAREGTLCHQCTAAVEEAEAPVYAEFAAADEAAAREVAVAVRPRALVLPAMPPKPAAPPAVVPTAQQVYASINAYVAHAEQRQEAARHLAATVLVERNADEPVSKLRDALKREINLILSIHT